MSAGSWRFRYIFGPVASRRLGRSLGVSNVPYKTCSYSCVYCQLGRTTGQTVERRRFYEPGSVAREIAVFFRELREEADHITFVPEGEPLLDAEMGREIERIKAEVGRPVAVLTNSSLLYLEEARADLMGADLVSVKVDAATEGAWRAVNRPHPALSLDRVLEGVEEFASSYRGTLVTETMLVDGLNTDPGELRRIARILRRLSPRRSYIAVPVRPPAEPYARPPGPAKLVEAYAVFAEELGEGRVELLNMPEPPGFRAYGDPEAWLLGLVSVHPLRLDYALRALGGLVEDPRELVRRLRERGEVDVVTYMGVEFVVRALRQHTRS